MVNEPTVNAPSYDARSYRHLENLEEIRVNHLSYINGQGSLGINHITQEFTDNINDENGVQKTDGFVFVFFDYTKKRLQFIVHDNGRAIPPEVLERSFTVRNFGTKFKDDKHASTSSSARVYKSSGGSLGVGSKVGIATATTAVAVSCRGDQGHAILTVKDGLIVRNDDRTALRLGQAMPANPLYYGTTIAYEPDLPKFFGDETFTEYEQGGINGLLNSIGKYSYFHDVSFTVYLIDHGLNMESLKTPDDVYNTVQKYKAEGRVIFSRETFNPQDWLHRYWNVSEKFTWGMSCNAVVSEDLSVNIQLFTGALQKLRSMRQPSVLGMVNGIQLDNPKADHISKLILELKTAVSKRITDNRSLVDFLMSDSTLLPLYMAVSVKFEYARFVGATKHDFRLREFEAPYRAFLSSYFEQPEVAVQIDALVESLRPWLETQFAISTGLVHLAKTDSRSLRARLGKNSNKFSDTNISDRSKAELLIVEGASAKPARYDDHQAYYLLRGKPSNCMVSSNLNEVRSAMMADEIYRNLIQIIGINVSNPDDMSGWRYGKIVIMADGDAHGSHIASILMVNLWAICPKLIEEGRIYVIQPPFHDVSYRGKSFYVDNIQQLLGWSIANVIMPCFDIKIQYLNGNLVSLPIEGSMGFFNAVYEYGRNLDLLAKENNTSISTAELVYMAAPYLNDRYSHLLTELFPDVNIRYVPKSQLLYLSSGETDEVINCQNMDRFYTALAPSAVVLKPKMMKVYITTKHTGLMKHRQMKLSEMYELMKSVVNMFHIRDLKGIGSMEPDDFYDACIVPTNRTRFMRQISCSGDIRKMVALMNKELSGERKLVVR